MCVMLSSNSFYSSLRGPALRRTEAIQKIVVPQGIDCRVVADAPPHTLPSRTAGPSNDECVA